MNIAEADWPSLDKETLVEHLEYVKNHPSEFEDMYAEYLDDYIFMIVDDRHV